MSLVSFGQFALSDATSAPGTLLHRAISSDLHNNNGEWGMRVTERKMKEKQTERGVRELLMAREQSNAVRPQVLE